MGCPTNSHATPSVELLRLNIHNIQADNVKTSLISMFIVSACPDRLFETLKKAPVAKYIQTLMEINVSFIAYESQVMKIEGYCFGVWWLGN